MFNRSGRHVAAVFFSVFAVGATSNVTALANSTEQPVGAVGAAIESRQTANSDEWATRNGGRVTRISSEPLRWEDRTGDLHPYDLDVERSPGGELAADVGSETATLPSEASDQKTVLRDGSAKVSLVLREARAVAPTALGPRSVRYPDTFPGVDRVLTTVPGGVKEDLVIESAAAARDFSYKLELSDGLKPSVGDDGNVSIRRGSDLIFLIPAGVAYEQNDTTTRSPLGRYELHSDGAGAWTLTVSLDQKWAGARDRKWPVVLDPTITVDRLTMPNGTECQTNFPGHEDRYNEMASCYAPIDYPSAGGSAFGTIDVNTGAEALLRWPLPGVLANRTVTQAKLGVYVTAMNGTAPAKLRVSTLNQLPSQGFEPDNYHSAVPTDVQEVAQSGSAVSFDLTTAVRRWLSVASGPDSNNGIAISTNPGNPGFPVSTPTTPQVAFSGSIGGSGNADPARRPYLDVYSAATAQAGSEVEYPAEGQMTSRFVDLGALAGSDNPTAATFEYLAPGAKDWKVVPAAALRGREDGKAPPAGAISIDKNRTSRMIWDLNKTPGGENDGDFHVRALLDAGSSSGGGVTPTRNFRLDRKNPETTSVTAVGPANVDMISGDLAVTEEDANVKAFLNDLSLSRTYHSRGGSPRTTDMFGPGWVSSFEVDGGEMPYRGIYNYTDVQETQELASWSVNETEAFWTTFDFNDLAVDPIFKTSRVENQYAVLEKADGSKLTFRKNGSDWVMDNYSPDVQVTQSGTTFTVRDADGGVTTFTPDSNGSPNYRPTEYAQPGSTSKTTYQYKLVDGRRRLSRIVAPTLSGISCPTGPSATWVAGCRALELNWVQHTFGGKSDWRVDDVNLRAVDPSGTVSATSTTIAHYDYDASGRLQRVSDPRTSTGLPTEYAYDATGRMTAYTPAGERPWTFDYQTIDGDSGAGRIRGVTRKNPAGVDATTTFVYDVPLSGSTAPNDLSPVSTARWGQKDRPWTATAVFPADATPSGVPASWARATISYLDVRGRTVNVADPLHGISTTEFDKNGNVSRELTARNRERVLAAADPPTRAALLDTQFVYAANGVDQQDRIGPEHEVRAPDGTVVLARDRVQTAYDAGKPAAFPGDLHLPTEIRQGSLRTSDGTNFDEQVVTNEYSSGASNRGWEVRKPLRTTTGSGTTGAITSTVVFDPTYPLVTEKRMPKAASSADPGTTTFSYYGINASDWCASGPGLTDGAAAGGMACSTSPGAQPNSGPSLLSSFTRYSLYWNPTVVRQATSASNVETSPVRTTVIGRDALDRPVSRTTTATTGRAIAPTTQTYSASTGRLTTSSTSALGSEPASSLTRVWDDNGRLSSYTDADGDTSTYSYDLAGRQTSVQDPRGTRQTSYDDADRVSAVSDSALSGSITATRDADGSLIREVLPDGVTGSTTYNEAGAPVSRKWERTAGCASNCTWFQSALSRDGLGRVTRNTTLNSDQTFGYDAVGRIATVSDRRNAVCTQRTYGYDKNSNRTSETKTVSAANGSCGSGSASTKATTVDAADRLTASGYSYDLLGRTSAIPAQDTPSGSGTTLTHDVDDLLATTSAGSTTQSLTRDPNRRLRSDTSTSTGLPTKTTLVRYASDEDVPSGRTSGSAWERYITDVDGTQIATRTNTSSTSWELTDLHGDTVVTVAPGATTATLREYTPFGAAAWSNASTGPVGLSHGWAGGAGKLSSFAPGGLVQMGARTYNPTTGRFLEVDPIPGGGANAYDYANQDPLNQSDLGGDATVWQTHWTVPDAQKWSRRIEKAALVIDAGGDAVPIPGLPGLAQKILAALGAGYLHLVAAQITDAAHLAEIKNERYKEPRYKNGKGMIGVYIKIKIPKGVEVKATKERSTKYNY
jgi:RHS repeat-associated protein